MHHLPSEPSKARHLRPCALLAVAMMVLPGVVAAQGMGLPPVLSEAALVKDKLGARAALDVSLIDENCHLCIPAKEISGERPVILNLGYFGCPGLCGAILNTLFDRMSQAGLEPGRDLDLITVSVHPTELPALAADKKHNYLEHLGHPAWGDRWHLLTGAEVETKRLAESVGWGYQYDPQQDVIDHAPVIVILSPKGVVTRYIDPQTSNPQTLRRAIIEAGEGKVGSFIEQLVVTCLTFDPRTGRYEVAAMTILRIGGAITVLAIATMIFLLWRREKRLRATALPAATSA
ncbi:MAG: SCO family protein [Planctomycetota bacterium]